MNLSNILPPYPRTIHLPWKPNAKREDLVASECEISNITNSYVFIEEKVDGANLAILKYKNEPLIRNHDHILRKGYYKKTPAKMQFVNVWNYYYKNQDKFDKLLDIAGTVAVYGEWMIAQHGMKYDNLPDWFIAYDLYDYEQKRFLATNQARHFLEICGFSLVPLIYQGKFPSFEQLEAFANQPTPFAKDALREGIFLKVSDKDNKYQEVKYKMVRQDFVQGGLWNKKVINRNELNEN